MAHSFVNDRYLVFEFYAKVLNLPKISDIFFVKYDSAEMNRNSWLHIWLALPRGQRRVMVVLLCVILLLGGIDMGWKIYENNHKTTTADYSLLEEDIAAFRLQLDTVPVANRRKTYIRHTKVVRDTVANKELPTKQRKGAKTSRQPEQRSMQAVPRVSK